VFEHAQQHRPKGVVGYAMPVHPDPPAERAACGCPFRVGVVDDWRQIVPRSAVVSALSAGLELGAGRASHGMTGRGSAGA
jgi:hypothetical protein